MDNAEKLPKWVMCMLCGDVIYGGPGVNPDGFSPARECTCGATVVLPSPVRGHVKWDAAKYEASNEIEPEIEWCEEGEVLTSRLPVAPPTTIASIYRKHMADVDRGIL